MLSTLPGRGCALGLAIALSLLAGCAQGTYLGDRGHDLLDIIDLKGGRSMGLGVKAEATLYLGAGLGFAGLGDSVEWYGRQRVDVDVPEEARYSHGMFTHIVVAGFDVNTVHGGGPSKDSLNILAINRVAFSDHDNPAMLDRWRFGGELVLPFVQGGIYLNVGQVLDLVIGLTTLDIGDDDGKPVIKIEEVTEDGGPPTCGRQRP
jgi:hypothetical protein